MFMRCQNALQRHFGNGDIASFNDLQVGEPAAMAESNSITLITANINSTLPANSTTWVVFGMIVGMNSGPVYGPAIEATRAQALEAAKANQKKTDIDISNRGGADPFRLTFLGSRPLPRVAVNGTETLTADETAAGALLRISGLSSRLGVYRFASNP